ncbi:hypothetical protein QBD01_000853 [Ochrobactrum sp. 19YEA23]|uniref:hypothetical protein n=1 Tax=Ochrobactrum sp. 19YEA23 TaxID=3039854 RepID=UPI0024790C78|nr:hypothetical protein [Ochrobactrum sp. 19YEA23]
MSREVKPLPHSGTRYGALERLIVDYERAYAQFLRTADSNTDLRSNGAAFEVLESKVYEFLEFPCGTLDSIRRKIDFVLADSDIYLFLLENEGNNNDYLRLFLTSLVAGRRI